MLAKTTGKTQFKDLNLRLYQFGVAMEHVIAPD
jgi:hypothetical protein